MAIITPHRVALEALLDGVEESVSRDIRARVVADLTDARAVLRELPDFIDYSVEDDGALDVWGGHGALAWRLLVGA